MMDRRTFISGVAVGLLTAAHGAKAQQARKVYKIGYLTLGGPSFPYRTAFVQGLREHGWIEDQNFILEARFAKGRREDLPRLARDLLRANVDVVVTTSTRETLAVKEATSTIPIVMTLVPDPVAEGIVASLARPGGNITGVTNLVPGLSQKYVELLRQAVPSAARFAVVTGPRGTLAAIRRELEAGATALGMELVFTAVQGPDDFDLVLAQAKKDGVGGIIVVADPLTLLHRRTLVQAAIKHRLPGMYWAREYVEDGGLMTYSANLADLFRHAATYVDKILRGAKPGDLPIEQPTKFDFVINMKTAKALGLTIPQSVLLRADEVIQ